jgi:hypothetical protein
MKGIAWVPCDVEATSFREAMEIAEDGGIDWLWEDQDTDDFVFNEVEDLDSGELRTLKDIDK